MNDDKLDYLLSLGPSALPLLHTYGIVDAGLLDEWSDVALRRLCTSMNMDPASSRGAKAARACIVDAVSQHVTQLRNQQHAHEDEDQLAGMDMDDDVPASAAAASAAAAAAPAPKHRSSRREKKQTLLFDPASSSASSSSTRSTSIDTIVPLHPPQVLHL